MTIEKPKLVNDSEELSIIFALMLEQAIDDEIEYRNVVRRRAHDGTVAERLGAKEASISMLRHVLHYEEMDAAVLVERSANIREMDDAISRHPSRR